MFPSGQKLGSPIISGIGKGTSVTTNDVELLHPFPSVTVTVYVPGSDTIIDSKFELVDHANVL